MEITKELLKIQLEDFIFEYNDIRGKLFLLKNEIINDSKTRFDIISKSILNLKNNISASLEQNKLILKELRKNKEVNEDEINKRMKKKKTMQKKQKELKSLVGINEEDYYNELNNFINIFNNIYGEIINLNVVNTELLGEFKKNEYFNDELIDELIELFEKYFLCIIKGKNLNNEMTLVNDELDLRNYKKRNKVN